VSLFTYADKRHLDSTSAFHAMRRRRRILVIEVEQSLVDFFLRGWARRGESPKTLMRKAR
jgi:hypothetical protein